MIDMSLVSIILAIYNYDIYLQSSIPACVIFCLNDSEKFIAELVEMKLFIEIAIKVLLSNVFRRHGT